MSRPEDHTSRVYEDSPLWIRARDRFLSAFSGADPRVCAAFWLFGLINNVLYVILLSAALDLVGPDMPKGLVLLADIIPAFVTKLIAPYFIHVVPYWFRVIVFVALSALGMMIVAMSPSYKDGGTIESKVVGIVFASLSAGGGELSFVGLTHFYGPFSLAAWSSGTGAAGLVGAGVYVLATTAWGFSVHSTLWASAGLPLIMALSFFFILPKADPQVGGYQAVERNEYPNDEEQDISPHEEQQGLLGVEAPSADAQKHIDVNKSSAWLDLLSANFQRLKRLFVPFMLPLLFVYIAEYVINQGVAPTLMFPIQETPFKHYRAFYPAYNAIYQIGVFLSRSSTPFFRVHRLYVFSMLQVVNLVVLILHAMFDFLPNVWFVFAIVFWEGLLGGLVYVNTFAEIGDRVPEEDREFSLGATTVSDSAGICIAGFISMALEGSLCGFQVAQGRDLCRQVYRRL